MNSVTSITFLPQHPYQSVTLRNIAPKLEFLNNFVSLTLNRNKRNILWRVRLSMCLKERKERNKEKKEIKTLSSLAKQGTTNITEKEMNPLEEAKKELGWN